MYIDPSPIIHDLFRSQLRVAVVFFEASRMIRDPHVDPLRI